MELLSFAKELLHEAAEAAAGCRLGQSAIRYADRALWTVEKSARWAVPPPLEQDERQPELIRPLPWILFLVLLVALRVARELISLMNLALGKPPLRSADMVTYIQGKRRYLRTLKYQGSRKMRARSEPESWRSGILSLFELTMCFRKSPCTRSTSQSSGDELMTVSRDEASMERLMEKMVQVEADTDDSGETLTETKGDSETTFNKSLRDSEELIVTSTPEKRDSTLAQEDIEALLSILQEERNGSKTGNGRSVHSPPAQDR